MGFTIQVDTLCHKIPNFIDKAGRAGRAARVHRPGEHQSGQPARGEEAAEHDHRVSGRCCRRGARPAPSPTPATSSAFPRTQRPRPARHRDHQARVAARYPRVFRADAVARFGGPQDVEGDRRVDGSRPEQVRPEPSRDASRSMSDAEWDEAYQAAWAKLIYTPEHLRTILRRAAAHPLGDRGRRADHDPVVHADDPVRVVHPLEGGAFRLKFRRDRRYGMKLRDAGWCSIRATPPRRW